MCLLRGRSTPAIRAIVAYPCRCLCLAFSQITRTTPWRRITLHLSQIFLTDALTFMKTSVVSHQLPVFSSLLARPQPLATDNWQLNFDPTISIYTDTQSDPGSNR